MKKKIVILVVMLLFITVNFSPSTGTKEIIKLTKNYFSNSNFGEGYTNITANELWELLNDTSNGIQIPIDVRTISEWREERIDTPFPEHPRWFPLDLFKNASILPKFLYQYHNCTVVLYCKGGYRSFIANIILNYSNFTGVIYNLVGGITAWKNAGLPTTNGHIYNITVYEAWELLNDTKNGIQKPIDIRSKEDWNKIRMDTPPPENPIHKNNTNISMEELIGEEIFFICKGGYRSLILTYEFYYNNFTGTLYHMIGGMNAWIEAGLPIIMENEPPIVEIINPKPYYIHLFGIPLIPIILIPTIDCISFGGFKLRPIIINATDDIDNSSYLIVKVYLNGEYKGNASYCCDWKLHEWFWTGPAQGVYNLTITGEDSLGAIGSDRMLIRNLCLI